jgi:hypothetical protein
MPFSSIAPSATCPSPSWLASGVALARVMSACVLVTPAPVDGSGQGAEARHHAANDRNATWNPSA